MKGVILARCPSATIVDISHDVPRHDIAHGAYVLWTAAPRFPERTVHVAVVDPGVGSERRAIVVVSGSQVFVGPDNGVFDLIEGQRAYAIEEPAFLAEDRSPTFHGRDVFAPAAAAIAAGARPSDAGRPVNLSSQGRSEEPRIIHVDHFGNLISNLRAADVEGARVRVAGSEALSVLGCYADAEPGELVAYIGSAGTIEVAVRNGSASDTLGVRRDTKLEVVDP